MAAVQRGGYDTVEQRADHWDNYCIPTAGRSHECERGTHECVRHGAIRYKGPKVLLGAVYGRYFLGSYQLMRAVKHGLGSGKGTQAFQNFGIVLERQAV